MEFRNVGMMTFPTEWKNKKWLMTNIYIYIHYNHAIPKYPTECKNKIQVPLTTNL
jgi:hypothetical protein